MIVYGYLPWLLMDTWRKKSEDVFMFIHIISIMTPPGFVGYILFSRQYAEGVELGTSVNVAGLQRDASE